MIARLEGILRTRDLQSVLLDVGGVGYEIEVPLSTLASLPEAGAPVVLFTHLVVREDAHTLFGFLRSRDRDLFRRLIRVNGIGARLALAMLSTMAADELAGHITGGNVAALTRVPGIGKRTAERVVLELGERLTELGFGAAAGGDAGTPARGIEREAAAALEALGYRAADAERMLAAVRGQAETTEALVRLALRATLRS
ncbi:Holliday junction branch migration protein RuvA [Thioalkalivibrio sp.]|uniref:Holliday junction branch migration protein RuvA n=1 Tax=Thioalkalivibrio sp. TaxID=2093813 RepID=UPI0012D590C6|nr:Holliday junction branch migration protein RuvA [Thioalkalivibrio sp.]TVP81233.1 MAG: Holliday junction branch migration protein RuvA [Thioalkalivibrio sp.]